MIDKNYFGKILMIPHSYALALLQVEEEINSRRGSSDISMYSIYLSQMTQHLIRYSAQSAASSSTPKTSVKQLEEVLKVLSTEL